MTKRRFTIDLTPNEHAQLERIKKDINAESKTEVFRKAVNLLNFIVDYQKENYTLVMRNDNSKKEKEIIFFLTKY